MLAMDFCPKGEFGLVLGFKSLLLVPPGTVTIEVVPDIRGADDGHIRSPWYLHRHYSLRSVASEGASENGKGWKGKYSTNFLIFWVCDIFLTFHAKTFLEENSGQQIIKA